MTIKISSSAPDKLVCAAAIFIACLMFVAVPTLAQNQKSFAPSTTQTGFESPEFAVAALIKAAAESDQASLGIILGANSNDIVSTGDPVQDKKRLSDFVAKANEKKSFEKQKNKAILLVGTDEWPLPIPIVKYKGKWYFDSESGREEILQRRIGANELDAIAICRGFVDAQKEYATQAHDGVNQYAQKIISSPGKQDGLYWQNADGTSGGPISEAIARAIAEGYSPEKRAPFHGYLFKVLKGQGPAAPLGKIDFVINDVMIGGFALVAAPAEYGVTGIKTFMVSHDGIVYQKDLGPDTLKAFAEIDLYNPDKSWSPTNDGWPVATVSASTNEQ